MRSKLQRIFTKGGVLSPGELKQIIKMAESLGFSTIKFGSRQDILFPYNPANKEIIEQYPNLNIDSSAKRNFQNIVCSYVSADIFPSTPWLKGSTYLYILEEFKYNPTLKINITDPKQQLVPLFSGQINFIASENEDYWHLNLKLPNWESEVEYPVLIYSWDIPKIAAAIEEFYEETTDINLLFNLINEKIETNNRTIEHKLEVPFHPFPYYEGMNKMSDNDYWLGLYWRNNEYDLSFLKDFCEFCLDSNVGKICITPWKSFIIKGLHRNHKLSLEKLLGKRGINVRHSSLELNWHLPVDDTEALELKKFIVRNFDQNDISTYGLNFGVSDSALKDTYFTSTVIEKNQSPTIIKDFKIRPTYNVLYCKNFNPNTREYLMYAQDVDKMELPGLLMELSKLYFENLGKEDEIKSNNELEHKPEKEVYQCTECLTVYDTDFGDKKANIAPGTTFNELPLDYSCSVCESSKNTYKLVTI
ncbi:rubredoxin domain-containing protein [Lutibacter sp. HS1-25]|uniref:rubredoxin domain-containing protein n=1 Tax=Lutibacter sp. HS1-25 TaxID=2485000 RepID=UPI001012E2C8|nr:rubredoxin domain-containing protein [Lutibacter sp. HS1-25]RXP55480.1 rubredoxin domain-containing protein [Lutibacter sp. HS1-25]